MGGNKLLPHIPLLRASPLLDIPKNLRKTKQENTPRSYLLVSFTPENIKDTGVTLQKR